MTRQVRESAGPTAAGFNNGSPAGFTQLPGTYEMIDTVSHNLSQLGKTDCGGPWLLMRDNYLYQMAKSQSGRWRGSDLVLTAGPGSMNHPDEPSNSSLNVKGATAISRTIPTNPSSSLATFGGELARDGLPSIPVINSWKERSKAANDAGSEFLNVEFGWLPLVNEMRNFAKVASNHGKILQDLKSGSGKMTRVGYQFPSSTVSSSWNGNALIYRAGNTGISDSVSAMYIAYQETNTWFKGAFTYSLPVSDSQLGKAALYAAYADKLLGVKPTPAAIWNSSPWTWALDWFTNAGDVVNNISALGQNGLVLKYGYIMSSCSTRETLTHAASPSDFGGYSAGSRVRLREFKKRLPAHPYGFGVTNDGLSNVQKAIIVALGLSSGKGGKG